MPKKSAQTIGWKSSQSQKRIKRTTKLGLIFLSLVFGIILIGQLFNFTKDLFKSRSNSGANKGYIWDGRYNLNLAVKAKSIALLSYNPVDKTITTVKVANNTFLEVPGGFGKWQVRAIYDLGQTNGGRGAELLKHSLSSLLGIPIDGFLSIEESSKVRDLDQLLAEFRKNPLSGFTQLPNLRTDLTLWELINLKLGLTQVRFDKVKSIDLARSNALDTDQLNDGTQVLIADQIKLDSLLTGFFESKIKDENLTIAIFNATNHLQLAQKAARIIANMGGNVIIMANSELNQQQSQVIGASSSTLERLRQVFDLGCGKDPRCVKICSARETDKDTAKACTKDPEVEESRAQINVVLGEDFYQRF